jgi:hypothetical protein
LTPSANPARFTPLLPRDSSELLAKMLIRDLIDTFYSWNSRHRAPATVSFYRTRLRKFCQKYNDRDLATLTPLEVDE